MQHIQGGELSLAELKEELPYVVLSDVNVLNLVCQTELGYKICQPLLSKGLLLNIFFPLN